MPFFAGSPNLPTSIAMRILTFVMLLGSYLMYASYSSFLIAFLTTDSGFIPFTSPEGLLKHSNTYRFYCVAGSAGVEYFQVISCTIQTFKNNDTLSPGLYLSTCEISS